ncbi:transcription and mRNA export factor ENY2-like protein [Dinothrombium tinctorium]|uniref:Transcription and mRNA export factor ENY2 n=1 Tax=Dinothrombium tinctorium TaxID=1965070 RepID=A0A443RQ35_9ACAR|nr:transcription and mRNA export factor ENY2-like protein [Dinothrombium tinctorium]
MNANSGFEDEKTPKLRAITRQKLVETGEIDRLTELLRTRLLESGWKEELLAMCKEYVRCKGVDSLSVDELVSYVTPKARQMVPDSIKRELLQRIKQFLVNQINSKCQIESSEGFSK